MQFITDITRSEMCKTINDSTIMLIAATKFFVGENKKFNFEMLLMDYYNSLMIKKNMKTLDEKDIAFLELVNNNKVDDLMYLTANLDFISGAFTAMVNFQSLAVLDKYQITRIANYEKEENDLTNRALYKLNYLSTGLLNDSKNLINYYKDYIDKNGDGIFNHDSARDIILNHLLEIYSKNFNDYKKVLAQAIPVYYKWGKYIISKHKKEVDSISKIFIKRIEWLKFDDLISLTIYDKEFLLDILTQFLYFETLSSEYTGEVEKFSEKCLTKRMKKKIDKIKTTSD